MASFLDVCRFFPTAGGTSDWTVSSAVGGYQTPSAAGAVNGALYRYRAESSDLTQWEVGYGTYNTSTGVLSRTTVLFNSLGTTAKIGFSTVPQVAIVALAEDIGSWTNRRLAKTAAYTVAQTDAGMTLALGGSAYYTVIFPQPTSTSFDATHTNKVVNEDTGRGKLLLPFYTSSSTSLAIATGSKAFTVPAGLLFKSMQRYRAYSLANSANFMAGYATYSGTTLTMTVDAIGGSGTFTDWQIAPEIVLWPGQNIDIFNDNNAWAYETRPWLNINGLALNVSPSGSDSNDGLATGGGALKTLTEAVRKHFTSIMQPYPAGPRVIDGGANTFQEFVDVEHVPLGGGIYQIQNLNWIAANNGYCLQIGDYSAVLLTSLTMKGVSAGATTPKGYIFMHQHSIIDINTGVTLWVDGLSASAIDGDGHYKVNINNGLTVTQSSGSIGQFLFNGSSPLSQWNINGLIAWVGTPVIGRFAWSACNSVFVLQGNVSFSGAVSTSAALASTGGGFLNLSGIAAASLPGGTPIVTSPGWYSTSL